MLRGAITSRANFYTVMVLLHLFPQFVVDSCTETKDFDPKQWFLSIFHYASKEQFAYQFFSLLCKGTLLERSVGSKRFASVLLTLLLINEGMKVMAMKGWELWGAAIIHSSICHGHLWKILFGMYGFILSAYHNWKALVIAASFAAELTFVYFFYPVIPMSSPVCGTLVGLLCSYAPQLAIYCWNMAHNCVTRPLQMIEMQENPNPLVWNCQFCKSANGVFLAACERCDARRGHIAYSNPVVDVQQNRMIFDITEPVWICRCCSSQNGVFVPVCESCGTTR